MRLRIQEGNRQFVGNLAQSTSTSKCKFESIFLKSRDLNLLPTYGQMSVAYLKAYVAFYDR